MLNALANFTCSVLDYIVLNFHIIPNEYKSYLEIYGLINCYALLILMYTKF